jgi:ABC-type transport system involved in cytochrome bd biosynthesis fused ATPase/permease subunit
MPERASAADAAGAIGNARALMDDLLDLARGRTVLLITHDLTQLDEVDEIVFLQRGRVLERGSQAELPRHDGAYACMWRRQEGSTGAVSSSSMLSGSRNGRM